MMAFLKFRDQYPHANVILHPASVILASTPEFVPFLPLWFSRSALTFAPFDFARNLFSDVQLRELMRAGELTVVDPKKLSPASPLYGNVTLAELTSGKLPSPPFVSPGELLGQNSHFPSAPN